MGGAWIMSQHIPDENSRSGLINLRELRGKRVVAQVSQTRRFTYQSGFDAPIGVVLEWEERGSCHNIYPDEKSRSGLRNLHELRGKRLVAQVSQTRQFANRSGFDAPIGVVLAWVGARLAWEERGSCLNIFRTTNRGRISETFTNYEAKDCCAIESNTSVRVVFANRSGFDAPIGVVLALEERGSCLNIFRTINRGRISETFTNYEAKDLLRKSVDHVLTYSGRQITVGTQKPSQITRQKTCCASESNTSVRVVFANQSGFDAPIGVVLAWEKRGSCLNILKTTNLGRISETFTNYEAKDLLHKNLHELRGKRRCAIESNTSVRVVFANRSGFDAPIGVILALEERGSCLNIFRTTNRGRISETITNYEAKDSLRNRLGVGGAWISTYSGRQIAVGSQKPSRITRQKTCCASESNASVRVVLVNGSGFGAPVGVVLAWEECGSCPNIFRMTNSRSELRNLHELRGKRLVAKVSQTHRFANRSGFDAPIGVVLAW
ncbi:uncharacterized protein G2W53_045106 [Senna tora]|uniref:Uncharacterized protein n=1 Tax=Senna tora TaxID=362788 RepID=A0A834W169_9FABA|nr:uncharacterized protein G2W53_045106 [Senna tora]